MKRPLLALTVITAIVLIGLIGFNEMKITGAQAAQTQSGLVNVTIAGATNIRLLVNSTNFGSGYVNASHDSAEIESRVPTKINWINDTGPFNPQSMELENNGTQVANVTIKADSSPAEFIGGGTGAIPDPAQYFKGTENETGACLSGVTSTYTDLQNDTEIILCEQFNYQSSTNALDIDFNLTIPVDTPAGEKTNLITFTATAYSP